MALTGVNTYTGATTLSAGTLSVGSIGNGGGSGNLGAASNAAANLVFDGGTLQYTGATASTNRNFTINAGKTATFDITTNNLTVSGASPATTGALTKTGAGTLTLSGANLYTGATTINAGILKVDNDGTTTFGKITGSSATGSIAVNTGGTLLLSGAGDHLADSSAMTLNGGTFNTGGFSETLGVLTLSLSSVIDMGTGSSILHFADSHLASWTGTLSIWNWSGNQGIGGGTDQLFFGGAGGGGLTASQLTQVKFYSDAGTTILPFAPGFSAFTGSFGEVVPVPEPSSVATVLGLLGLIGWRERGRSRRAARA